MEGCEDRRGAFQALRRIEVVALHHPSRRFMNVVKVLTRGFLKVTMTRSPLPSGLAMAVVSHLAGSGPSQYLDISAVA